MVKVLAHIVVHGAYPYLETVIAALQQLDGEFLLNIEITENGGFLPASCGLDQLCERSGVALFRNQINIGFSAAHNQAAFRFVRADYDYLLILNPDLALERGALRAMIDSYQQRERESIYLCPLLLRATETLTPIIPETIDSAGIEFTSTLRHFDRYAEQKLKEVSLCSGHIVGGSGACLLFSRQAVQQLVLPVLEHNEALYDVFPQLRVGTEERLELFDESFFAYREDAELALRAKALGVRGYLNVDARGYHVRQVTPERRESLAADINCHSVRNRFLLQILHWSPLRNPSSIVPGFFVRNLLVILGVLFRERSSLPAFRQVFVLWKRAWVRRLYIKSYNLARDGTHA